MRQIINRNRNRMDRRRNCLAVGREMRIPYKVLLVFTRLFHKYSRNGYQLHRHLEEVHTKTN